MISVKIEKEIRGENRVMGNFTFRQAICFVLVAVIVGILYFIIRPTDKSDMIPICLALGGIAWYFGFHQKSGIYMEYFLIKRLKGYILRNSTRKYRTKNEYFGLMNKAYKKDKADDLSNKKTAKALKKQEKKKTKKRSKLKMYR